MKSIYHCSDHGKFDSRIQVGAHLEHGHNPGSFVVDSENPNVYFVVLPSGKVKRTTASGVADILKSLPRALK